MKINRYPNDPVPQSPDFLLGTDKVTGKTYSYPISTFTTIGGDSVSNQYEQNNLTFTNVHSDYFGTQTTPRTGELTFDFTEAVIGGVAICYYQNSVLDIPAPLLILGQFDTVGINKIYFERDSEGYVVCTIINSAVSTPSGISNVYTQNNITFTNTTGDYFGLYSTPRTGTLTFDDTNAVVGGIAVVYYQNATWEVPTTIYKLGTFVPNTINKLYLERDSEGNVTCNIISAEPVSDETEPVITVTDIIETAPVITVT